MTEFQEQMRAEMETDLRSILREFRGDPDEWCRRWMELAWLRGHERGQRVMAETVGTMLDGPKK